MCVVDYKEDMFNGNSISDPCQMPRDPGPCQLAEIRWHYSPVDDRCFRFEYGGCKGNKNRYI